MTLVILGVTCFLMAIFCQIRWLLSEDLWYVIPMAVFAALAIWLGTLGIMQAFPG